MTTLTQEGLTEADGGYFRPNFDPFTIFLHWLTALLVLSQFATALSIDQVPSELAGTMLQVHRSTGAALWLVIAIRLGWRLTGMRLPPFPPKMAGWHRAGVHFSEYGLYGLLLVQPVTGVADTLWRGRAFVPFGEQIPPILTKNRELAMQAHTLRVWGAWALAGVVGVHASAALFHHFVLRDQILGSMLPWARRRRVPGFAGRA